VIDDAHIEILADHGLLLAIPAFAPAIAVAVAGVVVYIAIRDRRRKGDATHSENSDSARQDD
jgi:heme/copper-type cytochrome/quinol oxidase subunit 2